MKLEKAVAVKQEKQLYTYENLFFSAESDLIT